MRKARHGVPAGGREALEAACRRNLPLVHRIANRIARSSPPSITFDDLLSWGMEGLLSAASRYREDGGASFRTYVGARIRGAMFDGLRRENRQSRGISRRAEHLAATQSRLAMTLHREPALDELAAASGLGLSALQSVLVLTSTIAVPIDVLEKALDGASGEDPFAHVVAREQARQLGAALARLPARQANVLKLYYGEDRSLWEVGARLGLSEARAWQLRNEALATLRAMMTPRRS